MKILLITDLHLGVRNGNVNFLNMMEEYFKEEMFPLIEKENIKTVICLGDLLDKRKSIDYTISSFMKNVFFKYFSDHDITFYHLLGNHDIYFRTSLELDGPSQLLSEFENVKIIRTPTALNFSGRMFHLIPWVCKENEELVRNYLSDNSNPSAYVLGHFELNGFNIMKGLTFKSESDPVGKDLLSGFKKVFSGHFHTPSDDGNIFYIGSPYQLSWSDCGDKKKVFVYDTEEDEFTAVYTKKLYYHMIRYSDDIVNSFNYSGYENNHIKVIVNECSEERLNYFLKLLVSSSHPISLQVVDMKNVVQQDEVKIETFDNPINVMLGTIDNTGKDEKFIAYTKNLVNEIYNQAKEEMNI